MNVLIVDDSVVFRSQIKAALERAALFSDIDTANNGKIALQKLKQKKYDLMTLDLEMPELDGLGTLREMKNSNFDTRVIVFSSQSFSGAVKTLESLSMGADD
ncbi:MAG: response regulator, partial [Bdellovibrionales bacterium]|nr:response regulator [Bdellovibrionales bacterium]